MHIHGKMVCALFHCRNEAEARVSRVANGALLRSPHSKPGNIEHNPMEECHPQCSVAKPARQLI